MIDLIAKGFALRKKLSVANPQLFRSVSAIDTPYRATVPAISAESAISSKENNNNHYSIKSKNNSTADCAYLAETQSGQEIAVAGNVRDGCGSSSTENKINNAPSLAKFNSTDSTQRSSSVIVACDNCEQFTPDKIGDGAGIGDCGLGIKWTQEYNGRRPLFRYSERHCNDFSKLMT